MTYFDPSRPDFAPYGLGCIRWEPSAMGRADHHNEIELNLLESGWVTYLYGGRKVRVDAGRLTVFWAAIPHQVIECSGDSYYVVTIPFEWVLQFRLPDRLLQPLLGGRILGEATAERAEQDRALCQQWEIDLMSTQLDRREVAVLEMEARLRRLATHLPASRAEPTEGVSGARVTGDATLNKVEQMACLIARRYTEPLTVDDIAASVGLHPNYAMSLFKKAFHSTLMDYLTHHRISHAQRLLATTDMKMVEVALASGFNSLSRFNDAFRRACAASPRDYRRRHALSA